MKKKALSAVLAGMMLTSSVPLGAAVYAEDTEYDAAYDALNEGAVYDSAVEAAAYDDNGWAELANDETIAIEQSMIVNSWGRTNQDAMSAFDSDTSTGWLTKRANLSCIAGIVLDAGEGRTFDLTKIEALTSGTDRSGGRRMGIYGSNDDRIKDVDVDSIGIDFTKWNGNSNITNNMKEYLYSDLIGTITRYPDGDDVYQSLDITSDTDYRYITIIPDLDEWSSEAGIDVSVYDLKLYGVLMGEEIRRETITVDNGMIVQSWGAINNNVEYAFDGESDTVWETKRRQGEPFIAGVLLSAGDDSKFDLNGVSISSSNTENNAMVLGTDNPAIEQVDFGSSDKDLSNLEAMKAGLGIEDIYPIAAGTASEIGTAAIDCEYKYLIIVPDTSTWAPAQIDISDITLYGGISIQPEASAVPLSGGMVVNSWGEINNDPQNAVDGDEGTLWESRRRTSAPYIAGMVLDAGAGYKFDLSGAEILTKVTGECVNNHAMTIYGTNDDSIASADVGAVTDADLSNSENMEKRYGVKLLASSDSGKPTELASVNFEFAEDIGDYRYIIIIPDTTTWSPNPLTISIAEIDLLGQIVEDPDYTGFRKETGEVSANSTRSGLPAENAVDGSADTYWSTNWDDADSFDKDTNPYYIQIDLGESKEVSRIEYTPRKFADGDPSKGEINGVLTDYEIQGSNDGSEFEIVASGNTGFNATDLKYGTVTMTFAPKNYRYIRLVAKDCLHRIDQEWAYQFCCAELNVYTGGETSGMIAAAKES